MQSIFLAIICSVILTLSQNGWPAPKSAKAPATAPPSVPAPSALKDSRATAAADAEPAQSVGESAAMPAPAKTLAVRNSAQPRKKTAKSEAKTAPIKTEPQTAEDFKKVGDRFAKKGLIDKAMAAYKQCIERAGNDTAYEKIIRMLADYSHAKKRYEEAVKYYSMVKGKIREQPSFRINFGRSLQMIGQNAEAVEMLEPLAAYLKLRVNSRKEIMKILGDAYFESDMDEKAIIWYRKYLKAGGAMTADMAFLIAFSLEKSSPLQAKKRYAQNIKRFPSDYRNYLHLGVMLAQTKATAKHATVMLKKASDLAGSVPEAWMEIGKACGSVGKTDEERKAYQTCLKLDPGNLQAKIRLGMILLERDMIVDAITLLEGAYKQAPDNAELMASLAAAYMKMGKTTDAIELLTKAKAALPNDVAVRNLLFEAYRANGQDQQALEEIKAAIGLKRDNESLLAYGKLLLKMGRLDEAANAMEDIRSTAPDNIEALMILAMIFRAQNKLDEAIEIYKEVSFIDSKAAAPLYERAEVYLQQSKVKWAEQFYERALEADPKMAAAEVGLGKIALLYDKRQEYLDHLDKAAAINPNDPVVKKEIRNSRKPVTEKKEEEQGE